jgi:hypothetical protein
VIRFCLSFYLNIFIPYFLITSFRTLFSLQTFFFTLPRLFLSVPLTFSSVQQTFSLGQVILALQLMGIDYHLKPEVYLNTV